LLIITSWPLLLLLIIIMIFIIIIIWYWLAFFHIYFIDYFILAFHYWYFHYSFSLRLIITLIILRFHYYYIIYYYYAIIIHYCIHYYMPLILLHYITIIFTLIFYCPLRAITAIISHFITGWLMLPFFFHSFFPHWGHGLLMATGPSCHTAGLAGSRHYYTVFATCTQGQADTIYWPDFIVDWYWAIEADAEPSAGWHFHHLQMSIIVLLITDTATLAQIGHYCLLHFLRSAGHCIK